MSSQTMKAIVIERFGTPQDAYAFKDLAKPVPSPGQALIRIQAFGLNHAELHMRKGEWAEAAPVSGIECVGTIEACPDNSFPPGTKVAAMMGGMGRSINGTYAHYVVAPVTNVVDFGSTTLSWADLAAIPESYATAWTCLHRNLEIEKGQTLLIRGATSALGQAALNLAVHVGATVIATTRTASRIQMLKELGASSVELESSDLSSRLPNHFDAVLNLLGNDFLLDSLRLVRRGGRMCLAGFLGGLRPLQHFNPLTSMPSGVQFSFFGSFEFGAPGFEVSNVPMGEIVAMVGKGEFKAKPARVFKFEEIVEAHLCMEGGEAGGKCVVVV